jgi:hypothetical protein
MVRRFILRSHRAEPSYFKYFAIPMCDESIVSKLDEQVERSFGMAFPFSPLSFRESERPIVRKLDLQVGCRSRSDISLYGSGR